MTLSFPNGWPLPSDKQDLKRFTLSSFLTAIAPDRAINERSIKEQYIVVTKDSDFVESFLLRREPWKLLLISTGNIGNNDLEKLLLSSIQKVIEAFDGFDFIELSRTSMIFHL